MNQSARVWNGSSGKSTLFTFKETSWNEMYGIERLDLQFRNSVDLDNINILKISIQHPGRMFAPEIIDSNFTIERFNNYVLTSL